MTETGPDRGAPEAAAFGPWNPGIVSELPPELLEFSTMFRPENVHTTVAEARELRDFCGLDLYDLAVFRPERLIVHEVLVRATADISIPDGPNVEDLGINFRAIVAAILDRHVAPHVPAIVAAHDDLRRRALAAATAELTAHAAPPSTVAPARHGLLARLGLAGGAGRPAAETQEDRDRRALDTWSRKAVSSGEPFDAALYGALAQLAAAVMSRHGRLRGEPAFLAALVAGLVGNSYGSEIVGAAVEPFIADAVAAEGFRLLPPQAHPVVFNIKGASASGKSSMRPLQRRLADEIGVPWADFALISPDIWRKFLLDYETLGPHYKYAGTFTGHEIAAIDAKLDRYMARKAARGAMSHLLIDRFRFDSFAPEPDGEEGGALLTRFGHLVYMFFMVTPPEATVERSWARGLKVGRYKAVDDLLAHNVEAYEGMPRLFFTWALRSDKRVHCEFLDNSVAEGERPRTVAFGWNGELNILDAKCLIDVERYRKIDVDAKRPADVYPGGGAMAADRNLEFLRQCAQRIPAINFLDPATGRPYFRLERGRPVWADPDGLVRKLADPETGAALTALGAAPGFAASGPPPDIPGDAHRHTLGRWGEA